MVQALVETAVVGLGRAVRVLESWTGPLNLVLSGGGARSLGWQQIMADAFGRPILLSDAADTSLRGAALVCSERLGMLEDYEECGPELTLIKPNPPRAAAYAELIEASEVER